MRIVVDNGWRGPIAGVAHMAAVSVRADGLGVTLAIARPDLISAPQPGQVFEAGERRYEVTMRSAAPRGMILFLCREVG